MASFLTIPLMFWLGLAAIASPIIIHLLNRRRFKIIDWAAMEFLLNANKKNRRRVQLENLILLLLRCLAMFLLGLLLARPFFPNDANLFGDSQEFERVVLLDDSYSMQVRVGNKSLFDIAREKIKEFVRTLANDKSTNTISIYLASDIGQPVVTNNVTEETLNEILDAIDEIECSDAPADFAEGLRAMVDLTSSRRDEKNRIFYLVTDLRQSDWWSASQGDEGHPAQVMLKAVSENTRLGCYIVDVGKESGSGVNLAITHLAPESSLNSGVDSTFHVTVTNFGDQTVRNARIDFYESEGAVPKSEIIEVIEPGESRSVTRSFPVMYELDEPDSFEDNEEIANDVGYWKVWAEVHVDDVQQDAVEVDSRRYYAARVKRGVSILLVDGDPSAIEDRSETYYLRRALRPVDSNSGLLPTVVGVTELSSVDFSKYQIVYLCNVDELSEGQLESLEQWVAGGGNLVFMLGDQVNETIFNRQFYFDPAKARKHLYSGAATIQQRLQGGVGLSPVKLLGMKGDVNQETWVNLDLGETRSQITRVFEGQGNIAVSLVNFYSWWNSTQTGLDPVIEPVSPVLLPGRHYKFGPAHPAAAEYSDGDGEQEKVRQFEVDSRGLEIGASFVITDALGQFDRFPIRLTTTTNARFDLGGKVSDELLLNSVPDPEDNESHRFGCWRFEYTNGDVWKVRPEKPENVEDRGENSQVLARYTNETSDPAIVEKRFGKGRVVAFTFPADEDWTNLPQVGSANIILHLQMCEYLTAEQSDGGYRVGDVAQDVVDISRYEQNVVVAPPKGEKRNVKAIADDQAEGAMARFRVVKIPEMKQAGFYVVTLTRLEKTDGETVNEERILAANTDPREADLTRLDLQSVGAEYFGKKVSVIDGPQMSSQTVLGARTEYWMYVLFFLAGILILEQYLGWLFGRRR